MSQITEGIQAYLWALKEVSKGKLLYNLVMTGVISIILGTLLFYFAYNISDDLGDWFLSFYKWDFGKSFISKTLNLISGGTIGILGLLMYKYVIIIIVSPFMSPLSERLEKTLRGDKLLATGLQASSASWIRGLRLTLKNIWKEILFTLFLLLLSLIPGFAIVTGPMIFMVQAYYAGFGNMDYTLERYMGVREASRFVRKNKISAVTNGAIFLAILFIPILGLFLAPTLAAAAATKVTSARLHKA